LIRADVTEFVPNTRFAPFRLESENNASLRLQVIPADAGIQAVFELLWKKLGAGLRRHDEKLYFS